MLKMFAYDPSQRITLAEIKNHPWMKEPIVMKQVQNTIKSNLQEVRANSTVDSSQMAG